MSQLRESSQQDRRVYVGNPHFSYHNGYIPGQYINGAQHANGVQYANEEYANGEYANGQFTNRCGGYQQALARLSPLITCFPCRLPLAAADSTSSPYYRLRCILRHDRFAAGKNVHALSRCDDLRPGPMNKVYTPNGHMNTPNPKRGPKAARSGDGADDDSFDSNYTATSSRSKPTKRRKMSAPPVHLQALKSTALRESTNPSRQNHHRSPETRREAEPPAKLPSLMTPPKKRSRAFSQSSSHASKSNDLTKEEKRQNHFRSCSKLH